jgi:ATP-dependent RNA circularization protein (DNA/RNA ligase family)
MIEYPKIETLFVRDEKTRRVLPDQLRLPEFGIVNSWAVSEKIDGTNIRVGRENGEVQIRGRTDNAQFSVPAMEYLRSVFTADALRLVFPEDDANFILFGELYGPKIQKGGSYSPVLRFRLFDAKVGHWWLTRESVNDIAVQLGVLAAPELATINYIPRAAEELAELVDASVVATADGGTGCKAEGVVARSEPLLLMRNGNRVIWKLKFRDFA